ncbi:22688_t:CDS:2, partial [Gigaspora margarita]
DKRNPHLQEHLNSDVKNYDTESDEFAQISITWRNKMTPKPGTHILIQKGETLQRHGTAQTMKSAFTRTATSKTTIPKATSLQQSSNNTIIQNDTKTGNTSND